MKKRLLLLLAVGSIGFAIFWWLSAPLYSPVVASFPALPDGNASKGEAVFHASGCASCHAEKGAKGEAKNRLGGGHRLETPFGTFVTPNISPDPKTGIGDWSNREFVNALRHGESPQGTHFYPSFPYATYTRMTRQDMLDLFAYIKTLPEVVRANQPHELALPFRWRRLLGIWKRLFMDREWVAKVDENNEKLVRGRYLVEALGHCGECHTPRNLLGGLKKSSWLSGGPSPEGKGKIPNITPDETGLGAWSEADIAYYLESGFTPDFDSVGGSMVSVQENISKLSAKDREAIAAYLKAVPSVPGE